MSILGIVLVKDAIQEFYLTTNDALTPSQIPSLQNKYTHPNEIKRIPLNQHHQGRSQELEMGGAKLLCEGSGGRLRSKGGCTCTCDTPPPRLRP